MSTKSTTSELSKFVRATIAFITGDTDTATALKNERQSRAAIKGQLSALEGSQINAEMRLETALENLEKAIHPTSLISSHSTYYANIIDAQDEVENAQAELDNVNDAKDFASQLLNEKFFFKKRSLFISMEITS